MAADIRLAIMTFVQRWDRPSKTLRERPAGSQRLPGGRSARRRGTRVRRSPAHLQGRRDRQPGHGPRFERSARHPDRPDDHRPRGCRHPAPHVRRAAGPGGRAGGDRAGERAAGCPPAVPDSQGTAPVVPRRDPARAGGKTPTSDEFGCAIRATTPLRANTPIPTTIKWGELISSRAPAEAGLEARPALRADDPDRRSYHLQGRWMAVRRAGSGR